MKKKSRAVNGVLSESLGRNYHCSNLLLTKNSKTAFTPRPPRPHPHNESFPSPAKPFKARVGLGKESERRTAATVGDEGTGSDSAKPSFVRFPKTQLVVPPPLETEVEESSKTSNLVILWQVYALGAILVSRWIWARWTERRPKGGNPNDEDSQNRLSSDQNEGCKFKEMGCGI
ncbi:hypothetical protein K1719_036062 [Acacia pycnantha]|nr:hypothetical protein K1719_036062 [Acacia pycnantha]